MKRNSDLRNTWSSCVMQMLKRQTRVKGAVFYCRMYKKKKNKGGGGVGEGYAAMMIMIYIAFIS